MTSSWMIVRALSSFRLLRWRRHRCQALRAALNKLQCQAPFLATLKSSRYWELKESIQRMERANAPTFVGTSPRNLDVFVFGNPMRLEDNAVAQRLAHL